MECPLIPGNADIDRCFSYVDLGPISDIGAFNSWLVALATVGSVSEHFCSDCLGGRTYAP
jgi:hypothetical protein